MTEAPTDRIPTARRRAHPRRGGRGRADAAEAGRTGADARRRRGPARRGPRRPGSAERLDEARRSRGWSSCRHRAAAGRALLLAAAAVVVVGYGVGTVASQGTLSGSGTAESTADAAVAGSAARAGGTRRPSEPAPGSRTTARRRHAEAGPSGARLRARTRAEHAPSRAVRAARPSATHGVLRGPRRAETAPTARCSRDQSGAVPDCPAPPLEQGRPLAPRAVRRRARPSWSPARRAAELVEVTDLRPARGDELDRTVVAAADRADRPVLDRAGTSAGNVRRLGSFRLMARRRLPPGASSTPDREGPP